MDSNAFRDGDANTSNEYQIGYLSGGSGEQVVCPMRAQPPKTREDMQEYYRVHALGGLIAIRISTFGATHRILAGSTAAKGFIHVAPLLCCVS